MNLDDNNSSKFVMRNAMVKAVNVARKIGRSLLMYQECCTQRGKRKKKRIADDMVEIIEESFGFTLGMDGWYRFIINEHSLNYETRVLTPRQRIFFDLLDELPESEADNLLKTLEEKNSITI